MLRCCMCACICAQTQHNRTSPAGPSSADQKFRRQSPQVLRANNFRRQPNSGTRKEGGGGACTAVRCPPPPPPTPPFPSTMYGYLYSALRAYQTLERGAGTVGARQRRRQRRRGLWSLGRQGAREQGWDGAIRGFNAPCKQASEGRGVYQTVGVGASRPTPLRWLVEGVRGIGDGGWPPPQNQVGAGHAARAPLHTRLLPPSRPSSKIGGCGVCQSTTSSPGLSLTNHIFFCLGVVLEGRPSGPTGPCQLPTAGGWPPTAAGELSTASAEWPKFCSSHQAQTATACRQLNATCYEVMASGVCDWPMAGVVGPGAVTWLPYCVTLSVRRIGSFPSVR